MSKRSAKLLLEDITEAFGRINGYTEGMSFTDFNTDNKTKDAVVRNFEIIGETANQLPDSILDANPQVDWSGLIGFRNKLIHGYFGVDYNIVWFIIEKEMSNLSEELKLILENHIEP